MTDETGGPENSGEKQIAGRFQPGQSGNPAGKPRGTRNAVLRALDAIGEAAAGDVLAKVVEQAKEGDMRAAEVLLRRLWPERKGRAVTFALPPIVTAADAAKATGAVVAAVAAGELSPDEGQAVAAVLETYRRTLETAEMEARLARLEQAKEDRR